MSTFKKSVPEGIIATQVIGDSTYCITQIGEKLNEIVHNDGWSIPTGVGLAKLKTPVAYTQFDGKRVVVCLNAGNYLQNFVYDQDEGEWVAGQLAILKAESHPESKLTASYGGGKRYVFFQNPSAEIQEILANEDGIWKPSRTFSTSKPALGASLAAVILKDGVHVFYSHTDKSIHQVSLQGGKSTDSLVPYTDDGSSKSNIVVAPKDSSFGLEYLNAKNECYVLADGKSTKTGEITADGFQPVKGEQCYRPCGGGGNRGPIIIYGGTVIFY